MQHKQIARLAPILLAAFSAACAPSAAGVGGAAPGPAGAAAITEGDLRRRVETLAHDSMQGRAVGTAGAESAADYLVGEATRLGLRPAGDGGSFLHRVPLSRRRVVATVEVSAAHGNGRALTTEELVPVSGIGGLPGTTRGEGEGPLVYGGHLIDPEVEDEDLGLGDLLGAVVMVRLSPAPGADPGGDPRVPLAALFTPLSPAAAVILVSEAGGEELWEYARGIARSGNLELSGPDERGPLPPFFLMSEAEAERLLGGPLEAERHPRTGLGTLRYTLREEISQVDAWNVAAVLPGSDPAAAGEHVALGAHYDHEGVGPAVAGDSVFNGADDDASGVAALLEIAERYAAEPADRRPRRSLLFVWHTAEEAGLLGSRAFTDAPTVPIESVVAQLNIDMIGRNAPDSLSLVGSRRLSTALGDLVEEANRALPRPFSLDYSLDAPNHPEQVYCRSDHYNYARLGIPVVFFTTGLHEDYHQPSDEADTLDYDKLARATRLVGDVAARLADLPSRPLVDRQPPASECAM